MAEPTLLLDDLAAWLATSAGLAVGTDITRFAFADEATLATKITATGGPQRPDKPVAQYTFQLLTRGQSHRAAFMRALQLYDAIYPPPDRRPLRNVELSNTWRALAIDAIQGPTDLGLSEGGKAQAVFNIIVTAGRRD